MSSESDGSYSEIDICDDGQWKKVRHKRKARSRLGSISKKNKPTRADINEIILGSTTSTNNLSIKTATKTTLNKNPQHKNFSPLMKEVTHKKYKYMFHLLTDTGCSRIIFCDLWDKIYPDVDDEIIKTKTGLLIKTNQEKTNIMKTLEKLVECKKILTFKETSQNSKPTTSTPIESYSVVIGSVEHEVEDKLISEHLQKLNLIHRYCKRITSQRQHKSPQPSLGSSVDLKTPLKHC